MAQDPIRANNHQARKHLLLPSHRCPSVRLSPVRPLIQQHASNVGRMLLAKMTIIAAMASVFDSRRPHPTRSREGGQGDEAASALPQPPPPGIPGACGEGDCSCGGACSNPTTGSPTGLSHVFEETVDDGDDSEHQVEGMSDLNNPANPFKDCLDGFPKLRTTDEPS